MAAVQDAKRQNFQNVLEGRPIFDPLWYSAHYRDVAILGMDSVEHFQKYGASLRRSPSRHFDARRYAARHGLAEEEDALAHYLANYAVPPRAEHAVDVADLKNKLWGGFSGLAVAGLEAALADTSLPNKTRAAAAFILGRWHALNENWDAAVEALKPIRRLDVSTYRGRKCKLLMIDCMTRSGAFDGAREMIDYTLERELSGHFICARSNLILAEKGADGTAERLEAINALYRGHGLSEIRLQDPALGFNFGNIAFDIPPARSVEGPKVSILVPVYNAGEFVDVAIKSLLSQTWSNIEVVAVEDCSPDDSWECLQALAAQDSRLRIFRNEQNMGAYPTRNRALSLSSGDYITVHDSDDWSHPQMIEVQMKALLANPDLRGTCSAMTRVYPDIRFILRPQRENLEYVHRSYPSLLMHRDNIMQLGEWDRVSANADDEFIQRARRLWGDEALADAEPNVPMSFFLVHENSLTQQKGTSLNSLTFGIRKEYGRQARYWRENKAAEMEGLSIARTSFKHPFPIPQGLGPKHWPRNTRYDIIIVSDLSLLGGTRRCNEGYILAAAEMGLRVGLFNWPRYDLKLVEMADEYVDLSYHENVDILVPEDEVECTAVLIHHPPILRHRIDATPRITADRVAILVNQSPMQCWSQSSYYYDPAEAEALCEEVFGRRPEWIAISQRVKDVLRIAGGYERVADRIFFPPFRGEVPAELPPLPEDLGSARDIRLGRHARDHWTKWPAQATDLGAAYCAEVPGITVSLLGGAGTPEKLLGEVPSNWHVLEFDSVPVSQFISELDFFLHFVHDDYIEEFGRNVMEAMAAGRVVILPSGFLDIFGDAAIYCEPEDVAQTVRAVWADSKRYRAQAERGLAFVHRNCARDVVKQNLQSLLSAKPSSEDI